MQQSSMQGRSECREAPAAHDVQMHMVDALACSTEHGLSVEAPSTLLTDWPAGSMEAADVTQLRDSSLTHGQACSAQLSTQLAPTQHMQVHMHD